MNITTFKIEFIDGRFTLIKTNYELQILDLNRIRTGLTEINFVNEIKEIHILKVEEIDIDTW